MYPSVAEKFFLPLANIGTRENTVGAFPVFIVSKNRDCDVTESHRNKSRDVPFLQTSPRCIEPLDPNVSSVPRTMVLAQGSQGSKGLLLPVYPRSQLFVRSPLCPGGIHLTGCVGWKRDAYFLSSPDPANKKIFAFT